MKKIISIILILLSVSQIFSQNTEAVISQITQNNSTLKALAKSNAADSVGNRTDIYLQNPEVGFNYLYGNPSVIGNRTDFSITQPFDFPTAYRYKKQVANLKNAQLKYTFQEQYKAIILQAKLTCIDLVYCNILINEYRKRFENAELIANSYKRKFDLGETNIMERNKAEINKLNSASELEKLQIEKTALLSELIGLNGNTPVTFDDTIFSENQISVDFETWYAEAEKRNPLLNRLKLEVEGTEKQENLSLALSLPKFSAGYMSERSIGEDFQGITVGISVPLFENKNKLKYAQLKTEAAKNYEIANKLQFYNALKMLHSKAITLQKSVAEYERNLQTFNNSELLYKALEKGEINLITYISELSFQYESNRNLLDLKKELQKTMAELNQY
ncbi:MAG TPA: transporter [Bacteroidales bacterium]|nr:transporter [Bacteroidales bacterium]